MHTELLADGRYPLGAKHRVPPCVYSICYVVCVTCVTVAIGLLGVDIAVAHRAFLALRRIKKYTPRNRYFLFKLYSLSLPFVQDSSLTHKFTCIPTSKLPSHSVLTFALSLSPPCLLKGSDQLLPRVYSRLTTT